MYTVGKVFVFDGETYGREDQTVETSVIEVECNYNGMTAYICHQLIPTTAFLVMAAHT